MLRRPCADRGKDPASVRLLSPSGRAALAVLTLEGELSPELLSSLRPQPHGDGPQYLSIIDAHGNTLDDGVWIPTGSNQVLFTPHGNPVVLEAVIEHLIECGARFDSGHSSYWDREDQLLKEALLLLASTPTVPGAEFLLCQAAALRAWAKSSQDSATVDANDLLSRSKIGLAFSEPRVIVLAGVPNSGKSTLLNRLVGYERVVVSPHAGTTRDRVEVPGVVHHRPVVWVDGAGLRDGSEGIEEQGILRVESALATDAHRILLIPPTGEVPPERFSLGEECLRVDSKADKIPTRSPSLLGSLGGLRVSGKSGEGIESLLEEVALRWLGGVDLPVEPTPFTKRQVSALEEIQDCDPMTEDLCRALAQLLEG